MNSHTAKEIWQKLALLNKNIYFNINTDLDLIYKHVWDITASCALAPLCHLVWTHPPETKRLLLFQRKQVMVSVQLIGPSTPTLKAERQNTKCS